MKRKCKACPTEVQAVCRYAFRRFWNDKSTNGEGCDYPLDAVAEAWRKDGWTPDKGVTGVISLPLPATAPAVSMTQPKMPVRPKVSAKITKQAELFFRGVK